MPGTPELPPDSFEPKTMTGLGSNEQGDTDMAERCPDIGEVVVPVTDAEFDDLIAKIEAPGSRTED